ncbi:MAG TPA: hypothetical protein PLI16_10105, partial [Bacteroidales bacterium]|nr:hypothetical protein [Bacteroidales bacterium]
MKKFLISLLVFSVQALFFSTQAQPWMQAPYLENNKSNLSNAGYQNATFYDIQKAFYSYWKDKPY